MLQTYRFKLRFALFFPTLIRKAKFTKGVSVCEVVTVPMQLKNLLWNRLDGAIRFKANRMIGKTFFNVCVIPQALELLRLVTFKVSGDTVRSKATGLNDSLSLTLLESTVDQYPCLESRQIKGSQNITHRYI
ncbi:hypothetical protein BGP81_02195 [Pseudomonas putida]|nr:hypothetical protein BGP81_02195 [Pseudomonas putida]